MKALIVFTVMVLGFSMLNMIHMGASASSYTDGINAYMEYQANRSNGVFRQPAIVKNK